MDRYTYEREALAAGYGLVCGCDEAGAGPLAGPVYAAAVILPLGLDVPGLDDSKKLTAKKREKEMPILLLPAGRKHYISADWSRGDLTSGGS